MIPLPLNPTLFLKVGCPFKVDWPREESISQILPVLGDAHVVHPALKVSLSPGRIGAVLSYCLLQFFNLLGVPRIPSQLPPGMTVTG